MIIYKTTNLKNNKIYIGQDTKNNPNYKGSGLLIARAIKKYGIDNFIKETIESCTDQEQLNIREKYWINYYNSCNRQIGYNISVGGQGGLLCDVKRISGKNYYLNKMSKEEKENHLNSFRRGINYWKSKGFTTITQIEEYIKNNYCGKNHSAKKFKTDEEYEKWLDLTRRGKNFWLYRCLSKKKRKEYIKNNYEGKNNPIYRNKSKEEIENWLKDNRRGENAPNAKYIYTIKTSTGIIYKTKCLKTICKEHGFNLHVLRKFIELSEGVRKEFTPRKKEYIGWTVTKEINET